MEEVTVFLRGLRSVRWRVRTRWNAPNEETAKPKAEPSQSGLLFFHFLSWLKHPLNLRQGRWGGRGDESQIRENGNVKEAGGFVDSISHGHGMMEGKEGRETKAWVGPRGGLG